MNIRQLPVVLFFGAFIFSAAATVHAAATVRLELVGERRVAATAFQEWSKALGRAGIRDVRIRTVDEAEKPTIDLQGTERNRVYVVTGIIHSRDELEVPGRRFRRSQAGQLAQWLKDLAEKGLPSSRPKLVAFGLTADQFERVLKDLAAPVGFDTKDMTRREVVKKLASRLNPPLRIDARMAGVLGDDKIEENYSALARGTVLAYLLRSAGLGFVPSASDDAVEYKLTSARKDVESWPAGTDAESLARDILPGLYEFHNVNVQNVAVAKVLQAVGKQLGATVLYDHNALAHHKIDLDRALVTLPKTKTNYSIALRKLLFQAGLRFQVRRDDAGKPLLWVTTIKPL